MKDEYRIDGHKLDCHIDKVWQWQNEQEVTPIYVEVSPTAVCNHRCTFCALDFINTVRQDDPQIPTTTLLRIGTEFAKADVRGVMFGGEGEPTLHPDLPHVIAHYSKLGIATALTTNGSRLSQEFGIEGGRELTWVKVSINGGTEKAYTAVHGKAGLEDCFYRIGEFKRGCGSFVPTVGCQAVAVPDNMSSLPQLCERAIDAGLDYVVIKPYSPNSYSLHKIDKIDEGVWDKWAEYCKKICGNRINLVMRDSAYCAIQSVQSYPHCLSVPHFWAYVRSNGDLVACSNHMNDPRFVLGNLASKSFESIWYSHTSMKRAELKKMMRSFDVSVCRKGCRMHSVNEWLYRISRPNAHKAFI